MQIPEQVDRPDLKFPHFEPAMPRELAKGQNIFDAIRKGDILLHQPYQSFAPVVNFLKEASNDPQVVAIKQTVYRTGAQSEMMDLLIHAFTLLGH